MLGGLSYIFTKDFGLLECFCYFVLLSEIHVDTVHVAITAQKKCLGAGVVNYILTRFPSLLTKRI